MTDNVVPASTKLRELAAERVELQALFDAGTDTAADINRVMVLNKAMDESFPGLVQELVNLRERKAQSRKALRAARLVFGEMDQSPGGLWDKSAWARLQVRDALDALGGMSFQGEPDAAIPGGSDG